MALIKRARWGRWGGGGGRRPPSAPTRTTFMSFSECSGVGVEPFGNCRKVFNYLSRNRVARVLSRRSENNRRFAFLQWKSLRGNVFPGIRTRLCLGNIILFIFFFFLCAIDRHAVSQTRLRRKN